MVWQDVYSVTSGSLQNTEVATESCNCRWSQPIWHKCVYVSRNFYCFFNQALQLIVSSYCNTEDFPVSKSVQNNVEYQKSGDNLYMTWFSHISFLISESCIVALLESLTSVYNDNKRQIYFCQTQLYVIQIIIYSNKTIISLHMWMRKLKLTNLIYAILDFNFLHKLKLSVINFNPFVKLMADVAACVRWIS